MDPCFDRELLKILTPEEIIYISIYIKEEHSGDSIASYFGEFIESTAYDKLFDFYADEMPYGIAKCRTGEPDKWIYHRLRERYDDLYP